MMIRTIRTTRTSTTCPSSASRVSIMATLAALGVAVWAGCGSGESTRYYCDSAACYECDAYGCAAVPSPTKSACTGTRSCSAGSACTDKGCTPTCSPNYPCEKGDVCKSGLCMSPAAEPGSKRDCTTQADCGDGRACAAGACTPAANACRFSSECEAGKVCADGRCLAGCDVAPCPGGSSCVRGLCAPSPRPSCSSDQECGVEAPRCTAGSCVTACVADTECVPGKYCELGVCAVDTRPKPNCTADAQCGGSTATAKRCVGGFCKYACTSSDETGDKYCRTVDNRIGSCAKDLVCRTAGEVNAQCVASGECRDGKTCIDNQCR